MTLSRNFSLEDAWQCAGDEAGKAGFVRRELKREGYMWPCRSKTQKKLDALQAAVNARRVAMGAAVEVCNRAVAQAERLDTSFSDDERNAFVLARGRFGYFMNALLDDVTKADESISELRGAAAFSQGHDPLLLAERLAETERRLARTEQTCRSLGAACGQMVEITGLKH